MAPTAEEQDRLACWWARHYRGRAAARGVGAEALLAACWLGVEEAAAAFDPRGGRGFPAHAAGSIRRRIAAVLGARRCTGHLFSQQTTAVPRVAADDRSLDRKSRDNLP